MKRIIILILCTILLPFTLLANDKWEVFNTYSTYTQLEEHNGLLYVRSDNAIFITDPNEGSSRSFTQLEGLSSSSVQYLAKCEELGSLVFVHSDGIVDVLTSENEIVSISDLKNKTVVGSKAINHVTICGSSLFIACDFGFVEINLKSYLIKNYHFTDSACDFAFSYAKGVYFALSKGGIWRCEEGKNWTNNTNWTQIESNRLIDVIVFGEDNENQCWILDSNKDIHILDSDGSYKNNSTRKCYEQLKASGNYVFSKGWGFDIIKKDTQDISYVQSSPLSACSDFYSVNDSTLYAVHPQKGLIKVQMKFQQNSHAQADLIEESSNYFEVAGAQINELALNQGVLAAISGYKMYAKGYTDMYLANANVNYLKDGEWSHISEADVNAQKLAGYEFRGLTDIAADPEINQRFYVSTLTTGLYQFDGDSITKHHFPTERITSVCCDEDGLLWIPKVYNDTALWSYDNSKDLWTPHPMANFTQQLYIGRILRQKHESHHLIWMMNGYPWNKGQIGILYNPENPDDNSKDQSAYITTLKDQDGNLYSFSSTLGYLYDICEDQKGQIWILTAIGPFVVTDVVSAFNYALKNPGIAQVTRIKVPRNDGTNLADYLLSSTTCTAMEVDQFNRKWIGTMDEGIYLISADGLREIEHFTTDNSPLHSNSINALAYDAEAKCLYISCDGGVVAYHTDDIEPAEDFSSFHCYPNPLRPDYYGDVEIVGLMENSQVSITDSTGNLIWKTTVTDGRTAWNGRDSQGERVTPGVYLIHGISKEASKGKICKLLVL